MFLGRHDCKLDTEVNNIVFNTEVAEYICGDKKRKHLCHITSTNIRLETICLSGPEIRNIKEQGVIIIFSLFLPQFAVQEN